MQNIRLINYNNPNDYFDIPWEWVSLPEPNLDDLESEANRGKLTAYLYRVRAGEVPNIKIPILKRLTQKQLKPLFKIVRPVHNNTDNIIYQPFDLEIASYESIS